MKKYQWVTIPLAIHGVVSLKDGTNVDICIGEDDGDPLFYINDILPHLGQNQAKKTLGEAIEGEQLNLLAGTRPYSTEEDGEQIKLNILALLNEKYGITETDFFSAELSAVPADKARDIGLDRAAIGSYGHDDRVCAYPALTSVIDNADSVHTLMCVLADKEEIGSEGTSGMQCAIFPDLIDEIAKSLGADPAVVRANSKCLSADVSAAYDPNFKDAFEKRNTPELSCGVVLIKYTGARGKSGTNDAASEYIGYLR
ncbi:MAG: aminopeptidase, partial [Clostridia bacterium]|nr:aminopeptidase [Clostridia bacterium]